MKKPVTFHPIIQKWFGSAFEKASPPQEKGWPEISAGKHTLIFAPTGSGKTLAAFLWCIDDLLGSLLNNHVSGIHTLYISPLKALNNDIHRNLDLPLDGIQREAEMAGTELPVIRKLVRTGDTPSSVRQAMLRQPPHILITTPESLYLLVTSVRGRELFRKLRYLIVDEIHAISGGKRGVHLSLTLERLMKLCEHEPVRIGLSATQRPLERIAAFLGGQQVGHGRLQPRVVSIVDCGHRKNLDLKVVSPVEDFGDLPDATVWPFVIEKIYALILEHKTTLVFVHMRSQAERIARWLNELFRKNHGEEAKDIALAHHGSISREMRYEIEERLKNGDIPSVIATGSLELGIDIGSIDLVVQLEAPRTVSSMLQRIGRSGHTLSATSKGRIIPMYPSDLDDAVALAHAALSSEIEETKVPENCLDVLAQQIIAEVSMRDWDRVELYDVVRSSYCYRNLTEHSFNGVIEMLAGRFAETPIKSLQARLNWDKVNDRLITRRGSRLLATLNGGTIPDRGYFSVYLADSNVKLGEMEEEFVFESRVGHVFFLGNNEWRIDAIDNHKIVVSPVDAAKPRPPFWKGDLMFRDFDSSMKVGAFRRRLQQEEISEVSAPEILSIADDSIARNLQTYLQRQIGHCVYLPTDTTVIAECFRDSANEPHILMHTCFGARVNGALAIMLASAFERNYHIQVQFSYDDDGLIFRTPDISAPLPIAEILRIPYQELEHLLIAAITDTPLFSVRFRYNAARALILDRSQPHRRIPLWLQRLRAADLLAVVRDHPDFPILVETCRDCLNDLFDLEALRVVIERVQSGEIIVREVQTPFPSPMAAGLMFDFLSSNIYEMDRARYPAQAAMVSTELLAEILSRESIPEIVTKDIADQCERRWQHLTSESKARDIEALFSIIENVGPLSIEELEGRSTGELSDWLELLSLTHRIIHVSHPVPGWIAASNADLFKDSDEAVRKRIRQYLQTVGPRTTGEIATAIAADPICVESVLGELCEEKVLVSGKLLIDVDEALWCEKQNFAEIYRRVIAARRPTDAPVDREGLYRFLLNWHVTREKMGRVTAIVECYSGFRFPVDTFEREIGGARMEAGNWKTAMDELSELVANGQVIARGHKSKEGGRMDISFIQRGTGSLFQEGPESDRCSGDGARILQFLRENGASFVRDIMAGTELGLSAVESELKHLTERSFIACEHYASWLKLVRPASRRKNVVATASQPWPPMSTTVMTRAARPSRRLFKERFQQELSLKDSRWFLTNAFAVQGKSLNRRLQAERQARLLLNRYGILVKEWYRHEDGLLPWYEIFQVLKRLEWQGEVRRGYFFDGLSGIQFALPEAIEVLRRMDQQGVARTEHPVLISSADPALPFGRAVQWDLQDCHGNAVAVTRAFSNHLVFLQSKPVFYSENFGSRLWCLAQISEDRLEKCIMLLKNWLRFPPGLRPRKKIQIEKIDAHPAAKSQLAGPLKKIGFEQTGEHLVLWPSAV
jgi:ATP-dependent Lhr-like helicase